MKLPIPRKKSKGARGDAPVASLSLVGPDLRVRGRLESTGEVQVRGVVAGDITAHRITLFADGCIEGSICAEEVHFHGRFTGEAVARSVVIRNGATIKGQIFHHIIEMEKGAYVDARFPWRPENYFEQVNEDLHQNGEESYGEIHAK